MTFKERVHKAFSDQLAIKIIALEAVLTDLFNSAKNETKSTAGDKHETALAMLQIEQENTRRQLASAFEHKALLAKFDPTQTSPEIRPGTLVITDRSILYLCAGLGKVNVDERIINAVSPVSPIGKKLLGKQPGAQFELNALLYSIEQIL